MSEYSIQAEDDYVQSANSLFSLHERGRLLERRSRPESPCPSVLR